MPKVRTLVALTLRAILRPEDRFLGELGRRVAASGAFVFVGGLCSLLVSEDRLWLAVTAGWDAAALVYLGLLTLYVRHGTPERTKSWARAWHTPRARSLRAVFGRVVGLGVVGFVSVVGLVSSAGLGDGIGPVRALSGLAVILAWAVVQASYGLLYAHLYYRRDPPGGLEFPGGDPPGLVDFFYFAVAVGTAFAVSDVRVVTRDVRGVVIGHSLLSFVYNAALLTVAFSTVLNAAAGSG